MFTGTFTPTPTASSLTKAPQFAGPTVPISVRYSTSTGIPEIPDTDPNSKPHGFALRFHLPEENGRRKHTDLVGHSTPHFPVKTGQDFIGFLKALGGGQIGDWLATHPETARFVTAQKPWPESFSMQSFYMLNAFKFVNADGKETFVRYQVLPEETFVTLADETITEKGPNYLFDEIEEKVTKGPVKYKLVVQVAEDGDVTDDITNEWPESRKLVELGTITVEKALEDSLKQQKHDIFDPIPRVDGIEPSADPILDFRAALYLVSGRKRREA